MIFSFGGGQRVERREQEEWQHGAMEIMVVTCKHHLLARRLSGLSRVLNVGRKMFSVHALALRPDRTGDEG